MKIIGISGKRGVGKTLFANLLGTKFDYEKISFAEPLKELSCQFFPFSKLDLHSITRKEKPYAEYSWSPREFLIGLGEFVRYYDKDFWARKGLDQCSDPKGAYVFDDVRYENEADKIIAMGGKVIRMERYEDENPYGKNLDIPSETALDKYGKFSYTIEKYQNKGIDDLRKLAAHVNSLF